jgi:HSP20 family molecular chaperone IbpA
MSDTNRAQRDELLLAKDTAQQGQRVPVNMFETAEAVVLVAPMPGVSPEDVEIVVEPDRVRLHAGLRTPAPKDYVLHEWDYGSFDRAVDLPSIYRGQITATLGKGQLAVSIARDGERSTGTRVVIHPTSV